MYKRVLIFTKKRWVVKTISEREENILGKNKILRVRLPNKKISLQEQYEFFKYLSLFLVEGLETARLIKSFAKRLKGENQSFYMSLARNIKEGEDLGKEFSKTQGFDKDINVFFYLGGLSGAWNNSFKEMAQHLRQKMIEAKKIKKKMVYPLLLFFSSMAVILGASVVIVPQLSNMFIAYEKEIPRALSLLTTPNVLGLLGLGVMLVLIGGGLVKGLSSELLVKIPVYGSWQRLKAERVFWFLFKLSRQNDLSMDKVLAEYLQENASKFEIFYLSAIRDRIKRGVPDIFERSFVSAKRRHLVELISEGEAFKELVPYLIEEASEEIQEKTELIFNLINIFLFSLVISMVAYLGYIMTIPLAAVIEVF